jgi:hypothetical protein
MISSSREHLSLATASCEAMILINKHRSKKRDEKRNSHTAHYATLSPDIRAPAEKTLLLYCCPANGTKKENDALTFVIVDIR